MPNPYQNPYGGGSSAYQYGPNPGQSGGDPRGRAQNQNQYQQQRYEQQQGPMVNAFAHNYGRGSESDYGNYTNMMNMYQGIASGGGSSGGGGGGGGGGFSAEGMYTPFTVSPERVSAERISSERLNPIERVTAGKSTYSDPFQSYAGFQEFGKTGGYSPTDIANLRARGVAPIRAAYSNAQREVGRGRSLQGGYSPNAAAAQVKMAREQGQSAADATQNVEAGIVDMRNRNRLSGYGGMAGIEGQRLDAELRNNMFNVGNELDASKFNSGQALQGNMFDVGNALDVSKFNSGQGLQAGMFNSEQGLKGGMYNADAYTRAQEQNINAAESAASRGAYSAAANRDDQLNALHGMAQLYGTTPGQSQLFGNQLLAGVGQGGQMGQGYVNNEINSGRSPGAWEQTMGRIGNMGDLYGMASTIAYPWLNNGNNRNRGTQGPTQTTQPGYSDEPWRGGR